MKNPGILWMLQVGLGLSLSGPMFVAGAIFVTDGRYLFGGFVFVCGLAALFAPNLLLRRVGARDPGSGDSLAIRERGFGADSLAAPTSLLARAGKTARVPSQPKKARASSQPRTDRPRPAGRVGYSRDFETADCGSSAARAGFVRQFKPGRRRENGPVSPVLALTVTVIVTLTLALALVRALE
ncbi:hypothetical protein ACFQMM_14005 [Saliphagus sp. GCM10025308]